MTRTSRIAHRATVALMSVAVLVVTGDGFAQSYSGLLRWATKHHVTGWKADSFPLLVDLFILVGELGLFALALEGHKVTRRALSWLDLAVPAGIAAAGWIVSSASFPSCSPARPTRIVWSPPWSMGSEPANSPSCRAVTAQGQPSALPSNPYAPS